MTSETKSQAPSLHPASQTSSVFFKTPNAGVRSIWEPKVAGKAVSEHADALNRPYKKK